MSVLLTTSLCVVSAQHGRQHGHEMSPVSCPRRGVHHTSPTDGCIHRLTVGCHNDHIIEIDHSCSAPAQRGNLFYFLNEKSCKYEQNNIDKIQSSQ